MLHHAARARLGIPFAPHGSAATLPWPAGGEAPSDISLRPLRGLQSGSVSPSPRLTVGTPPLPPMLRSGDSRPASCSLWPYRDAG